jgi:hypothetical protein
MVCLNRFDWYYGHCPLSQAINLTVFRIIDLYLSSGGKESRRTYFGRDFGKKLFFVTVPVTGR